jgi:hypothetical protein
VVDRSSTRPQRWTGRAVHRTGRGSLRGTLVVAQCEELTLVTNDDEIQKYDVPVHAVWPVSVPGWR